MAKVIHFPARKSGRSPQAIDLPTLPIRQQILELWRNRRPGSEIERRLGVTAEQIKRVLWAWQEINSRQGRLARLCYRPQLEFRFREIEIDVWQEAKEGPLVPPPSVRKAA